MKKQELLRAEHDESQNRKDVFKTITFPQKLGELIVCTVKRDHAAENQCDVQSGRVS